MNKFIYSCASHIEELLEAFLDEIEEMPIIEKATRAGVECHKCQGKSLYKIFGSEVKTKWE